MKTRIDVISCEESFMNLSSFKEVEEMNKTVRHYRDLIKTSIKRIDVQARLINLLEILKRHSCKYVGVSYMHKNTIAEKMEVSYKTIQRLVKKLEELGTIKQVPMKRKTDMMQTSNAIIILPFEELTDKTQPKKTDKCPTIKTTSLSLKQKIKNINTRKKNVSEIKESNSSFSKANFIAHWIPKEFATLANYFYSDAATIEEFWKVVKQCNKTDTKGNKAFDKYQEIQIGIQSFKEFANKMKGGKPIKNIFGYFNGIVNKLMDKYYFDPEFMRDHLDN